LIELNQSEGKNQSQVFLVNFTLSGQNPIQSQF